MTATATTGTHQRRRWSATDLALIAVFTAFVIVCSILPGIPVGPLGVPITLQTFAVMTTALVLGGTRGGIAVVLYVVLGLIGLPVFSGFRGGIGVLAGPSAGYIIAFPIAAFVIGWAGYRILRARPKFTLLWLVVASLASSLVIVHGLGILGMMINAQLAFGAAVAADAMYLPGDVIKTVVACAIAFAVHKAYGRFLTSHA
ncbi:biotin transporter BioY [Haematomicrobium sanguinis]|uniref:biotin transporter BioY n=1 Tax=Haematomicrobium sanguinis TaxID=479106 RepID=UPI000553F390|nr:biotin transporter BioY [Haematomicrobium sanguinis]